MQLLLAGRCGAGGCGPGQHCPDPGQAVQRQRQHLCPRRAAKGHEGPRRTATATSETATATPFVHGGHRGPRRATKNVNYNCRTATSTPFVHEGPRRAAKNCNCNGNFRNGNGNTFCPRRTQRATEGHEERQLQLQNGNGNTFCPRRATVILVMGVIFVIGDSLPGQLSLPQSITAIS